MRTKLLPCALFLVLAVAIGVQFFARAATKKAGGGSDRIVFAQLEKIGRGSGTALPLASSEFLTKEVERTLRYDAVASYSFEGGAVTLYAAYWSAGAMSVREVAFHTPDHCWVANGWRRVEKISANAVADSALKNAQQRLFEKQGTRVYTACWHLVGGRCLVYNEDGPPDNLSIVTDLGQFGFAQKRGQLFVRVTSTAPLELMRSRKVIGEILTALAGGISQ
jgi:hypothetical protein